VGSFALCEMLNARVPQTISLSGHNVPRSHDSGIPVPEVFYERSRQTRERSYLKPIARVTGATVQPSENPFNRLTLYISLKHPILKSFCSLTGFK